MYCKWCRAKIHSSNVNEQFCSEDCREIYEIEQNSKLTNFIETNLER